MSPSSSMVVGARYVTTPLWPNLSDTRSSLTTLHNSLDQVNEKISEAQGELEHLIQQQQAVISRLQREREELKEKEKETLAYLSPMRTVPNEILREIFLWSFEDYACSAWVYSAVSWKWRKVCLETPKLWTKIRLVTTRYSSPDTVRLWLERSGNTLPLDIEIYLRAAVVQPPTLTRKGGSPRPTPKAIFDQTREDHGKQILPPGEIPPVNPHPITSYQFWSEYNSKDAALKDVGHWGCVAFFYLVESMHRWERFIFRFDMFFPSISALNTLKGRAPLLKEYELSTSDAKAFPTLDASYSGSNSNTSTTTTPVSTYTLIPRCPNLERLTFINAPFRWDSPAFHKCKLTHLALHPVPYQLALDRIFLIVAGNAESLQSLSLHFTNLLIPVLPLQPIRLEELKSLSVGGSNLLLTIVNKITTPKLESLVLDIDYPYSNLESSAKELLHRSQYPPVGSFSLWCSSSPTYPCGTASTNNAYTPTTFSGLPPPPPLPPPFGASTIPMIPPLPSTLPTSFPPANSPPWYSHPPSGLHSNARNVEWISLLRRMPHLHTLNVGTVSAGPLFYSLTGSKSSSGFGGPAFAANATSWGSWGVPNGGNNSNQNNSTNNINNNLSTNANGGNGNTTANGQASTGTGNNNANPTTANLPPSDGWLCPKLKTLRLKDCSATSDMTSKMVKMIESRNPGKVQTRASSSTTTTTGGTSSGSASAPSTSTSTSSSQHTAVRRIKTIELTNISSGSSSSVSASSTSSSPFAPPFSASTLGPDIIQWLKKKVEEVAVSPSPYHASSKPSCLPEASTSTSAKTSTNAIDMDGWDSDGDGTSLGLGVELPIAYEYVSREDDGDYDSDSWY